MFCVLLIRTDISSIFKAWEVEFLLTKKKIMKKEKKIECSQSNNRNERMIKFAIDISKEHLVGNIFNGYSMRSVEIFYIFYKLLSNSVN